MRGVKTQGRSDRETSLARRREECVDRFATDRETVRRKLRNRPTDPEDDIDRLVEEYLKDEQEEWFTESAMIQCPLCRTGYVLMPVPGIVVCDHCSELRLRFSNEGWGISEFGLALDTTLQTHASHSVFFEVHDNVLFARCDTCASIDVVIYLLFLPYHCKHWHVFTLYNM